MPEGHYVDPQGAHEVLGALLMTAVSHDEMACFAGFQRAKALGLIEPVGNPRLTPLGRGVLRAFGLLHEEGNHA